jgi:hypothetical protein
MVDFIAEYLQRRERDTETDVQTTTTTTTNAQVVPVDDYDNNNDDVDDDNSYTHLVALPVGSCHELVGVGIGERVQRAVLYPILVPACIAPSVMRVPLLYVKQQQQTTTTSMSSHRRVTEILYEMLQQLITKHVFVVTSLVGYNSELATAAAASSIDGFAVVVVSVTS